jgi:adenylate cyclase
MRDRDEREMESLNAHGWPGGVARLEIGVGVNSGHLVAGTLGGVGRLDYTVVGDAVNVAARLQAEAAGGDVLVSEETLRRAAWPDADPVGERALKGRREPVEAYRVRWDAPGRAAAATPG